MAYGGGGGSAGYYYAELQKCVKGFCKVVNVVVNNVTLRVDDFADRKVYLSEAYSLLWQNAGTGNVDGRISSMYLRIGALTAVLIDLHILGKINIVTDLVRKQKGSNSFLMVEVKDEKPTETYLDAAIFDKIVEKHRNSPQKPCRSVYKWLEKHGENCSVTLALDNLVEKRILDKKSSGLFGVFKKYPTLVGSVEASLVKEMRAAALHEKKPDSFTLALLALTRTADNFYVCKDPILAKHFPKEDYKEIKKNIKKLVEEM